MFGPPDPRSRPTVTRVTWQRFVVSYAAVLAVVALLWLVANPLAGVAVLAATLVVLFGTRSAVRLHRCLRNCRGVAFDLAGRVRISITRPPLDECCEA